MELLAFEATIIGLVFLARWLDQREGVEPAKETVALPEWLLNVLGEKMVLTTKRVSRPIKKELHQSVQSAIDRAVFELERALETIRQEDINYFSATKQNNYGKLYQILRQRINVVYCWFKG
jgi:hypothetical protein